MKTDYSKILRSKCSTLVLSIIYDVGCILFTGFWTGYNGYFISIENDTISKVVLLVLFSVELIAFLYFIQNLIKSIREYKKFNPVSYLEELKKEEELIKKAEEYCLIKNDF